MKVARFNETFPQAELQRIEQAERDAAHRAAKTPECSQARRRRLPSEEDCDLIVLDDMMNNVTSEISQMFTVGSHLLFRNNRDLSQASCFGRQAFPGRGNRKMNRLNRHVHLLHVLAGASPAQRKAILKNASNDQIKTLCEICQNLLSGNIATNNIKKLCSYKRVIRLLADRSVPISRKRKLFTTNRQVGGFLPLVLPAVLSVIGGLVGKSIGKRI
ncbi:uncharacterized protein TNCV_2579611 [Trichonephila clavipes]|uniref:Uncharacterized protein n=1 Tax=Trichonephila clavipes TaxID=2585209 RepID=A0A8X6VHW7_TRICX|nr:uncharacterized protein TNCV_2579611 [Trichonephila clavipes]